MKIAGKIFAIVILLSFLACSGLCEIVPFANEAFAIDVQSDELFYTRDTKDLPDGEKAILDSAADLEAIFETEDTMVLVYYYANNTDDYADGSKISRLSSCLILGESSDSDFLRDSVSIYPTNSGFVTTEKRRKWGINFFYK